MPRYFKDPDAIAKLDEGGSTFGVARHTDITIATLRATCRALNRLHQG